MQQPTCSNIRIRSTADAHKIFGAVQQGVLHMVTRRLDADERLALRSGCIYAWEERGPHSELTGLGIERFTEGRRWSPSRVRDVRGVETCQKNATQSLVNYSIGISFLLREILSAAGCNAPWVGRFFLVPSQAVATSNAKNLILPGFRRSANHHATGIHLSSKRIQFGFKQIKVVENGI